MTELDEYVWRKDGAYGFDVGEFGSRAKMTYFIGPNSQS